MTPLLLASLVLALDLPEHPRLLFDAAGVDAFAAKMAQPEWAPRWTALVESLDRDLAEPVELPPRGGNWSHNYACPQHGARLKTLARIGPWEWEHECPVGPHTLRGDRADARTDHDGNAIMSAHSSLAGQAINCGLAWQVTGERRYLERAREILLAYADRYLTYELHDNQGRPGRGARVASQWLTEASWLVGPLQAADLIWAELSAAERTALETKLFRPAVEEIILPPFGVVHNIHCWGASAIGLLGYLVGDEALVARAVAPDRGGMRQQLAEGVRDDGMWYEGASGYHFYTIDGMLPLIIAAGHCGEDLWTPRFKSMFDAPLILGTPDLRLPDFNDSAAENLVSRRDVWEVAYARWGDPAYLPLLAAGARSGRRALLYGVADLPAATDTPPTAVSRNSPASGYAILQSGPEREATWLCLKYGPHGGGHGHYDKNTFIFRARRTDLMPDGGVHAYGAPLRPWDKTSVAHNTLVVDERDQAEATGASLGFGSSGGIDWSISDAGPIYEGVRFRRAVALLDPTLLLVVDHVRAAEPRTLDLAAHFGGRWLDAPPGAPWATPDRPGYRLLTETTTRAAEDATYLAVDPGDGGPATMVTLAAAPEPTEVILGLGLGASTDIRPPTALFRRQAAETWYAWTVSLDGQPASLICLPDDETARLVVVRGADMWRLTVDVGAGEVGVIE